MPKLGDQRTYFIRQGDHVVQGPFPEGKIRRWLETGKLQPEMLISEDQENWVRCTEALALRRGHAVLFIPAYLLVQQLLVAKRELLLDRALKRLDRYEAVLIDDIGYVQQDREEMEVLFTFLSARYERRSVMITSNLVFSQWEKIFKDPMTTACAIDRLVHHASILELTGPSYRAEAAKRRTKALSKAGTS